MESFPLYNGCSPTALYLPLQTLSSNTNIREFPFEGWNLPDDRAYSDCDGLDYAAVEKRTGQLPTWPLLTLPLKRSIHHLAANQCHDVEQARMVPNKIFRCFKRTKEISMLPLITPQSSGRTTSPEEIYGSSPTSKPSDVRLIEWNRNDEIAAINGAKPLLSPIQFTPPCESKVPNRASSEPSNKGNGSSTYFFYPPRNPADNFPQTSDPHRNVPHRQLSYGEPFHNSKPNSLHRAIGSDQLRRKAGWETDDDDIGSWLEGSLKASAIRPWFSEPARNKPRLWLDLAEESEKIEEAYATTVTSSPTKPQLISIPRRRAITITDSAPTPIQHKHINPNIFPATPPDTPASQLGLGIDSLEAYKKEKERLAFEKIKARPTWTSTPPTVTISTLDATGTLPNIPPTSTPKTRPDTPRPFHSPTPVPQLSELKTWILTELEHSLSSHEPSKLQLDSPVIQQLRLPPAQRRVPRCPPSTLPLSRYSTYNPLSSHPPNIPTPTINSQGTSAAPLTALHTIFPHAPLPTLGTLQATIIALHHVSSIYLPSPSLSPSSSPFPYPSPSSVPRTHSHMPAKSTPLRSPDISYIPSKARAMLGLQPSSTSRPMRPTLPSSWLRPQVSSWGERVEELQVGFSKEVGRLIEECLAGGMHGGQVGKVEGALVRAVGQVVRMGESGNMNMIADCGKRWDTRDEILGNVSTGDRWE